MKSEQMQADFEEESKFKRKEQHGIRFCFIALAWRQATVMAKLHHLSGLKNPEDGTWSNQSWETVERIPERIAPEKERPEFCV